MKSHSAHCTCCTLYYSARSVFPMKSHCVKNYSAMALILTLSMYLIWTIFHLCAAAVDWPLSDYYTTVQFQPNSKTVEIGKQTTVSLQLNKPLRATSTFFFTYEVGNSEIAYNQSHAIIRPLPNLTLLMGQSEANITISGMAAGSVSVGINSSSMEIINVEEAYLRVGVVHSSPLVIINTVIGWIYFLAWSISFYPQVYINWKRKSVVGLNFDFLAYNLVGFLAYGLFNIGMFWISSIKNEYHGMHPRGINPVRLNDVIFTIHAVFITTVTIVQTLIYESGGQRVSRISSIILGLIWLFATITLFVAVGQKITWLTYLYYFSYIKLGITIIKFIPQAYMNFKRKSTLGWSIGNVLLDLTGGCFSLLQMFLLAYNHDDWSSIFGDPTKFGLGFFSILFDIFFIVQHYCLYRGQIGYDVIISESTCAAEQGGENGQ